MSGTPPTEHMLLHTATLLTLGHLLVPRVELLRGELLPGVADAEPLDSRLLLTVVYVALAKRFGELVKVLLGKVLFGVLSTESTYHDLLGARIDLTLLSCLAPNFKRLLTLLTGMLVAVSMMHGFLLELSSPTTILHCFEERGRLSKGASPNLILP